VFYVGGTYEVQDGTVTKYYYAAGQRVAMRQNGVLTTLHSDHLGSTSLTTDAAGGLVARVLYYPYGETRWMTGTLTTDYTYTGQRGEGAGLGGLMDYGARHYDPSLGRFISADTIVPGVGSQAQNRYMYVGGNPLKYVDPTGHVTVDPERAQQLLDYALGLIDQDLTQAERFELFMQYAVTLYYDDDGNFDTDQFMVDVTAILHGHEYDTEGGYRFYTKRQDCSSKFFIGNHQEDGWKFFHADGEPTSEGWDKKYDDESYAQVYHFWFYVACAYFDGEGIAYAGNFKHDGASVIGEDAARAWNLGVSIGFPIGNGAIVDILAPSVTKEMVEGLSLDIGVGVSKADYDLGLAGIELASDLRSGMDPRLIPGWLSTELSYYHSSNQVVVNANL
jgi:RHS repeat-associated protein